MPSPIIHLAIAERYAELHPEKVSNSDDFRKGSIAPDLDDDFSRILSKPEKAITHYYCIPGEDKTDFEAFKHDESVDLTNDYWKGYYAHLLADYLFYASFFKEETDRSINDDANLYDDFTVLTSKIIKDYHPQLNGGFITDTVKQYLIAKDGECRYLNYVKVCDFIENVSSDYLVL